MKYISLVICLLLVGCFSQQFVAPTVDKPVMMSGAAAEKKEFTIVKHFDRSDRSGWWIFALIKGGQTDVDKILNEEIKSSGGDAVINLKISGIFDPLDVLIWAVIGGIYNTRYTEIEGDIIKYK
jgi:hypothetical protein